MLESWWVHMQKIAIYDKSRPLGSVEAIKEINPVNGTSELHVRTSTGIRIFKNLPEMKKDGSVKLMGDNDLYAVLSA